ncbi:hypothetical protein [Trichothermofontia sp.]
MTSDSHLFKTELAPGRLPLYEGKMIHQFTHQWGQPKYWLDEAEVREKLLSTRIKSVRNFLKSLNPSFIIDEKTLALDYETYRLAFRDVAANTNERTVIMTVLPPKVFCPHTMSLKQVYETRVYLSHRERLFVFTVMNSFVIDTWLRRSITTHVSFSFVYNIPVP